MSAPDDRAQSSSAASAEASPRTVLDWAREAGEADGVIAELNAVLQRRRRRRMGLAAGGMAVLVLAALLRPAWRTPLVSTPETETRTATVTILRPEARTLPDGSVVDLNAGAEIDVDFSEAWRRVTLRRGEAHFRVASNPQRPFVVTVGTVEVQAVGTAFSVGLGHQAVEVLVTEGVVTVNASGGESAQPGSVAASPGEQTPTFAAGNMIVVPFKPAEGATPSRQVSTLSRTDIDQHLAWRVPRLEFAGTPLAQVVPMFNQHGQVRMALADPALGQLRLSGVLRADDTETLLRLLEGEFGLTADTRENEIVIRRR